MTGLIELIIFGKMDSYSMKKSLLSRFSFSIGNFSFSPNTIAGLTRKDLIYITGNVYSGKKNQHGIFKRYFHFFTVYNYDVDLSKENALKNLFEFKREPFLK